MKKRQAVFKVKLDVPKGVYVAELQEYVADAVKWWCKQFFPGDYDTPGNPLFDLDPASVKVTRLREPLDAPSH